MTSRSRLWSLWVGMPRLPAEAVRANGIRSSGRNGGSGAVSEEPNLLWSLADLRIFESDVSVDISELPMSVQGACAARVVVSLACSPAKTHI